jgi:hypothetical protein
MKVQTLKEYNSIRSIFNRYIKEISFEDNYKLYLNIIYFYKLYKILFINTEVKIEKKDIILLIIRSFLKIKNNNNKDIIFFTNKSIKNGLNNYINISYNILLNTLKIISINNKTIKNTDLLYSNNKDIINITDFINNNKINYYTFNSMFKNKLSNGLIDFLNKNINI